MGIFNKFSIKKRLIFMVCFSVLFYTGFSGFAIYGITHLNNLINRLIDYPVAGSTAALNVQLNARELRNIIQSRVSSDEEINSQIILNEFSEKEKELRANLDEIQEQSVSPNAVSLITDTRKMVDEWITYQKKALTLLVNDDLEGVKKHFNREESEYSKKVFNQIHEVSLLANSNAQIYRENAKQNQQELIFLLTTFWIVCTAILVVLYFLTHRSISESIQKLKKAMSDSVEHNTFVSVELDGKNEIVAMSNDYNRLINILKKQFYIVDGQTKLTEELAGVNKVNRLAEKSICFLADYIKAGHGVFYIYNQEKQQLKLMSSYAYTERDYSGNSFKLGEGIIGQVALEKKPILLKNINKSEKSITTGTSNEAPLNIYTFPIQYENELYGVIELSSFEPIEGLKQQFLLEAGKFIAINLFTTVQSEKIKGLLEETRDNNEKLEEQQLISMKQSQEIKEHNVKLKELLDRSHHQAEELQVKQEELRQANEELEQQTEILKMSEEKLQTQQEELRVTNEELEERATILEKQKNSIEEQNIQLLKAQKEIKEYAEQLEITGKYKTEFLANMSHELRTPLNSIIVLSQILAEKTNASPLSENQLQFAKTINQSGQDLIKLINDILDLSKVEAGKIDLVIEKVELVEVVNLIERQFSEIAAQKGLKFVVDMNEEELPRIIKTDRQRLEQVLRNLISNAIKFTEVGSVTIKVDRPLVDELVGSKLSQSNSIRFIIDDTGIGIPKDKQRIIFEAFQQVDGTISRKYGGTGLGLSISKEFTKLLQGKLLMDSKEGIGTTFTLIVPEWIKEENDSTIPEKHINEHKNSNKPELNLETEEIINYKISQNDYDNHETSIDDLMVSNQEEASLNGKTILVVDDDMRNLFVLTSILENEGMTVIAGKNGKDGIEKLQNNASIDLIIMDVMMPEMDGFTAMAEIRKMEDFQSIPIIALTAKSMKEDRSKCIEMGANDYLTKPIDQLKLLSLLRVWLYK